MAPCTLCQILPSGGFTLYATVFASSVYIVCEATWNAGWVETRTNGNKSNGREGMNMDGHRTGRGDASFNCNRTHNASRCNLAQTETIVHRREPSNEMRYFRLIFLEQLFAGLLRYKTAASAAS